MNLAHLDKKKQLQRERDSILMQIRTLKEKAEKISVELVELEKVIDVRELAVTDHAIERFKQRAIDIPTKKIRQMLTSNELTQAYRKKGDGVFTVAGMPHIRAVIRDFTIITVINTSDPEERIKMLREYMNYYIEELALKYTSEPEVKIMKLKTFKDRYWAHKKTAYNG
jgi:hypothetical protein